MSFRAVIGGSLTATAVKTTNYSAAAGDYVLVSTLSGAVTVTLPSAPPVGTRIGVALVQVPATPTTNTVGIVRSGTDVFDIAGSGKTSYGNALSMLGQAIVFRYVSGVWYIETGAPTRGVSSGGGIVLQANSGAGGSQPINVYDGAVKYASFANIGNSQTNYSGAIYVRGKNGNWNHGVDTAAGTPNRDWFLIPLDTSDNTLRSDFLYATHPGTATGTGSLNVGYRDNGVSTPSELRTAALIAWGDGRNLGQHTAQLVYVASQTGHLLIATDTAGANPVFGVTAAGLPEWSAAANAQTTVGAAGAASALPAAPTKYLKVVDSAGTTLVVPAYAAA